MLYKEIARYTLQSFCSLGISVICLKASTPYDDKVLSGVIPIPHFIIVSSNRVTNIRISTMLFDTTTLERYPINKFTYLHTLSMDGVAT